MTLEQILQNRMGELLFVVAQQEAQIAALTVELARQQGAKPSPDRPAQLTEITEDMVNRAESYFLEWMGDDWPAARPAPGWLPGLLSAALR